jgi:Secretion system C-terminal sorting domain
MKFSLHFKVHLQISLLFAIYSTTMMAQGTMTINGSDCFSNITLSQQPTLADGKIWFKSTNMIPINNTGQVLMFNDFLQCRWYATTYGQPMWVIGPLNSGDYLYRIFPNSNNTPPTTGWEPFDCSNNITINLVLPIELISFEGKKISDLTNLLTWRTASETENKGCDIERSTDGVRFDKIGFVAGNGTTTTTQTYTFEDIAPNKGTSYYRLKQLDFDGRFEYSKIISVAQNDKNVASVYPNPSKGVFTILGLKEVEEETFTLMNTFGQTLSVNVSNDGQLNMTAFPTAMYFLRVASSGQVIRLVKE